METILAIIATQRAAIKKNLDKLLETFDLHEDKAAVRATMGMMAECDRMRDQIIKSLQPQQESHNGS